MIYMAFLVKLPISFFPKLGHLVVDEQGIGPLQEEVWLLLNNKEGSIFRVEIGPWVKLDIRFGQGIAWQVDKGQKVITSIFRRQWQSVIQPLEGSGWHSITRRYPISYWKDARVCKEFSAYEKTTADVIRLI